VQSPEFKPQSHQGKKRERERRREKSGGEGRGEERKGEDTE
jgi:hypothetical protein